MRNKGIRVNCICPGPTVTDLVVPRHLMSQEEAEARDKKPKLSWVIHDTSVVSSFERFLFCSVGQFFKFIFWHDVHVYDKDHMSELRIKNRSESDPCSYEVTKGVRNKVHAENILRLQRDSNLWPPVRWLSVCLSVCLSYSLPTLANKHSLLMKYSDYMNFFIRSDFQCIFLLKCRDRCQEYFGNDRRWQQSGVCSSRACRAGNTLSRVPRCKELLLIIHVQAMNRLEHMVHRIRP